MKALILLVLVFVMQKSSCDLRDVNQIAIDVFGTPPPDGGSTNGGNGGSNNGNNGAGGDDNVAYCGTYRDKSIATYILNGIETKYVQYPWMVALFRTKTSGCRLESTGCWKFKFGGSLINMNVVLTSAHNVLGIKENRLKARAGDWDLSTTIEVLPHQERMVQKIIIHNQYSHSKEPAKVEYDAALLVMETPYTEYDNVATICLPQPDLVHSENCKTGGWGKIKYGTNEPFENILKVVDLNEVSRTKCRYTLTREARQRVYVHKSFMCAVGDNGEDSCQGDGGSPLMCSDNPDYYYQRGIVSWGIGCGKRGVPGVYTDVAKIRNWIDQQMTLHNFNSKSYIYVP